MAILIGDVIVEGVKEFSFIVRSNFRWQLVAVASRMLIVLVLLADLAYLTSRLPALTFRFGRFLRPLLPFYYIKLYYQQLIAIIKSFQEILILVLFYLAVNWTMAFVCTQLFGFEDYKPAN